MPIAVLGARMVDFLIAFVILMLLLLWYGIVPNSGIMVLPLLVLIMAMSAAGLGLALTALAIQYRDINYGMSFAVQLLMFTAPVVYPARMVKGGWIYLYALNPMVGVIEGFRAALLSSRPMPWAMICLGGVVAGFILTGGILYFRRKENIFADVA